MTGKVRYIGFALLAALLALTSCRDLALDPVFYALSQEQPLGDDRGFPDEASVSRMVKIGNRDTSPLPTGCTPGPTAPPIPGQSSPRRRMPAYATAWKFWATDIYASFATGSRQWTLSKRA